MIRFRLWLTKLYIHYCVRVDKKFKCPACGHRKKHKIVYSPSYRALIHQCTFCTAVFSEKPLVAAELWSVEPQIEAAEENPVMPGAPREPLRAKQ
jgi:rubredoxin